MKERRLLLYLVLLIAVLLTTLLLWHLLCALFSYSEVTNLIDVPAYVIHSAQHNFSYPLNLLGINDYNLLVNYSFNFDILNLGCNEKTLLIVLIHSGPGNFRKRSVIRNTWGSRNNDIKIYFVLGNSDNFDTQRLIEKENNNYKDLIQGRFLDTYRNLTYKHIVTLKYTIYHCFQAKYILKTDDDVFVNMPLLKKFLTVDLSPFGISKALFCIVKKDVKVLRSYRSKWRVAFQEYPFRTYPLHCPGWVILYSPDVVFALYKSAQNTSDVFWIDDVHITGTLAAKNNISHTDIKKFVISEDDQRHLLEDHIFPKSPFLFGQYDLKGTEIEVMWSSVLSHRVPKSIFHNTRT